MQHPGGRYSPKQALRPPLAFLASDSISKSGVKLREAQVKLVLKSGDRSKVEKSGALREKQVSIYRAPTMVPQTLQISSAGLRSSYFDHLLLSFFYSAIHPKTYIF